MKFTFLGLLTPTSSHSSTPRMRHFRAPPGSPKMGNRKMGTSLYSISLDIHNDLEREAFLYIPLFLNRRVNITSRGISRICQVPFTPGPLHVLFLLLEMLVFPSIPYFADTCTYFCLSSNIISSGRTFQGLQARPCQVSLFIAFMSSCPYLSELLLWCIHISVWLSD